MSDDPDTKKAGYGRIGSAFLWGAGGIVLTKYGNQAVPEQLRKLEDKFAAFLQKEGVPLDADVLRKADAHTQRGWFQKIEDFMYNYPIECTNAYYALASTGMLASGLIRSKSDSKNVQNSGVANIATTALILAGTLTSILVPERSKEQIAARGQTGTFMGRIQERPLDFAVWMYMASDLSIGYEARGEYNAAKALGKNDPFKKWALVMPIVSVFSMICGLFSDAVTGFSSKKAGGSDEDRTAAQEQLMKDAAAIMAAQPPEAQQKLVKMAAKFFSEQPELRMTNFDPAPLEKKLIEAIRNHSAKPAFSLQGEHSAKLLAENLSAQSYMPLR